MRHRGNNQTGAPPRSPRGVADPSTPLRLAGGRGLAASQATGSKGLRPLVGSRGETLGLIFPRRRHDPGRAVAGGDRGVGSGAGGRTSGRSGVARLFPRPAVHRRQGPAGDFRSVLVGAAQPGAAGRRLRPGRGAQPHRRGGAGGKRAAADDGLLRAFAGGGRGRSGAVHRSGLCAGGGVAARAGLDHRAASGETVGASGLGLGGDAAMAVAAFPGHLRRRAGGRGRRRAGRGQRGFAGQYPEGLARGRGGASGGGRGGDRPDAPFPHRPALPGPRQRRGGRGVQGRLGRGSGRKRAVGRPAGRGEAGGIGGGFLRRGGGARPWRWRRR